jgi:hypothetical protein
VCITWQCQLKEKCKNFVAYSIAIDESTDVKNIAQLAIFVRGVNENFELVELLELVPMKGKTGADEIVSQLVTLLNKFQLPWGKMVGKKTALQPKKNRGNEFFQ